MSLIYVVEDDSNIREIETIRIVGIKLLLLKMRKAFIESWRREFQTWCFWM